MHGKVPDLGYSWLLGSQWPGAAKCFLCTILLNLHTDHESRHRIILTQQMREWRHREVENLPEATL